MLFDRPIEKRLRNRRIVDFAMSMATIADEIDDNITLERIAIVGSDLCHSNHGVYVFRIHVKNGDGLTLGQIGSEARRLVFAGHGGETDQIVGNDMKCAADRVSWKIGVV